jgi:hypothetical protein
MRVCVPRTGDAGGAGRIRARVAAAVAAGLCQGGETVLGSHGGYGFATSDFQMIKARSLKADCSEWKYCAVIHFFAHTQQITQLRVEF